MKSSNSLTFAGLLRVVASVRSWATSSLMSGRVETSRSAVSAESVLMPDSERADRLAVGGEPASEPLELVDE